MDAGLVKCQRGVGNGIHEARMWLDGDKARSFTITGWRYSVEIVVHLGFVLLVGIVSVCLVGCAKPRAQEGGDNSAPKVALFPGKHRIELGTLRAGAIREELVPFWNDTPDRVELTSITTSCPCLVVSVSSMVIGPNDIVQARVIVDTSQERDFAGSLLLEARAVTGDGRTAFLLHVAVDMTRETASQDTDTNAAPAEDQGRSQNKQKDQAELFQCHQPGLTGKHRFTQERPIAALACTTFHFLGGD